MTSPSGFPGSDSVYSCITRGRHSHIQEFFHRKNGMNWEIGLDINRLLCIEEVTNEDRLHSTGNPLSALWGPTWEGNPKKRGHRYVQS